MAGSVKINDLAILYFDLLRDVNRHAATMTIGAIAAYSGIGGNRGYGEAKSPSGLSGGRKPDWGFCVTRANLALRG